MFEAAARAALTLCAYAQRASANKHVDTWTAAQAKSAMDQLSGAGKKEVGRKDGVDMSNRDRG